MAGLGLGLECRYEPGEPVGGVRRNVDRFLIDLRGTLNQSLAWWTLDAPPIPDCMGNCLKRKLPKKEIA